MVTVELSTADDAEHLGAGKEYRLVLGGGQAIPGIEELIMEATPGQTVERPVKWPDDFPDEIAARRRPSRCASRSARSSASHFRRSTTRLRARSVTSIPRMRWSAAVREDLAKSAAREADADVRQRLLDDIGSANPFEIPPSWVQRLVDAYAAGVSDPRRRSSAVRERVSAGGREPGAPGARSSRRSPSAKGSTATRGRCR